MHENGKIPTDGTIRVSLDQKRKDRIRLDCIRKGRLTTILLSSATALDLIEELRGARYQLAGGPGVAQAEDVVKQIDAMREHDPATGSVGRNSFTGRHSVSPGFRTRYLITTPPSICWRE